MDYRLALTLPVLLILSAVAPAQEPPHTTAAPASDQEEAKRAVRAVLTDVRAAAAAADGERFFGHFAPEAVYIGTDATERWTLPELRRTLDPYFEQGRGWPSTVAGRSVLVAKGGAVAWFEERAKRPDLAPMHASGVLLKVKGTWKIVQYHVSFLVPNELYRDLVASIARLPGHTKQEQPVRFPEPPETPAGSPEEEVKRVLTDFQRAASEASTERYLGYLAPEALVFGTDAKERYTRRQVEALVKPYFDRGQGWTSVPRDQRVFFASAGDFAWFDQKKIRADGGELRTSGVLRRTADGWRIVHYNTALPIPNSLARELPLMIEKVSRGK